MRQLRTLLLIAVAIACAHISSAQSGAKYTIKKGKMVVELSRSLNDSGLHAFLQQFELRELGIYALFRQNKQDSLLQRGWEILSNDENTLVISKPLIAADDLLVHLETSLDKEIFGSTSARFPSVSAGTRFGYNRFRNKEPFVVKDSIVQFFLRGHEKAETVFLSGSFRNWKPDAIPMNRVKGGWAASVALTPGKYWYKFIVDGNWQYDSDNLERESDEVGNINSVYFQPNTVFALEGNTDAKRVVVSGSFNNWNEKSLQMQRKAGGWELPVYLADGTHTYKFIVGGNWISDPSNTSVVADGHGSFNSVIRKGKTHLFRLDGFADASEVKLVGSFNDWRDFEWSLHRTNGGWELPFVVGPGNHEYKFVVDGKWISDPGNDMRSADGNSFLIVDPNYTFRLKGREDAKTVFLAGDFNNWSPGTLPMKRDGKDWVFSVHLAPGKVRYKFIVDGQWVLDPSNKLWEGNEFDTGNSLLWFDPEKS